MTWLSALAQGLRQFNRALATALIVLSPVAATALAEQRAEDLGPCATLSADVIAPCIVWRLCRSRHNRHYADVRIMPTCVGNPACGAGIAAKGSA
jgi:hypothetical protein